MVKVVFLATPKIALNSLEYLFKSKDIEVVAVVTQPDKPVGRGHKIKYSCIKEFALEHNIPCFQPKSIRKEIDIQNELKKLAPDFFVTFAFGQILSQEVLDIPKYETINLHVSLLPKYRGANPIQRAIMNGDTETGICTMITQLELDCGDICLTEKINIDEKMNCVELFDIVSKKSPMLIEKTLLGLVNNTITPCKQSEEGVSFAAKLTKEECKIDWSKSAEAIHNLVRGIYQCPSAYFEYKGKSIKVLETVVMQGHGKIGEFINIDNSGVEVACKSGSLRLVKVKPEGKREMLASDWFRGVK